MTWEDRLPKRRAAPLYASSVHVKKHVFLWECVCVGIYFTESIFENWQEKKLWFIESYFLMLWIIVQFYVNCFLARVIDWLPHPIISWALQVGEQADNQMVNTICALSCMLNYSETSVYRGTDQGLDVSRRMCLSSWWLCLPGSFYHQLSPLLMA